MTELTKNYIEIQFENQKLIKKSTCILLTDDKYQKYYKGDGTGILVEFGDAGFLISAAHVFENFENLRIPLKTENSMLKPGGELFINEINGTRKEDRIDIGFLKLDKKSKIELQLSYDFLNQESIEINHEVLNHPFYSFFGYPTSLSNFSKTRNSFHTRPFFQFTTPILIKEYSRFPVNANFNIVSTYDQKKAYSMKGKCFSSGPSLHGISGCGLWFTDPIDAIVKTKKPKLVAIMTEWAKEIDHSRIIGTRIDVLTEAIRKNCNIDFPESNIISIN